MRTVTPLPGGSLQSCCLLLAQSTMDDTAGRDCPIAYQDKLLVAYEFRDINLRHQHAKAVVSPGV